MKLNEFSANSFSGNYFFRNLNWCAKDCWQLKDAKGTPDATLKKGQIKDVKDLQIETPIDMAVEICSLTRSHLSD